MLLTGFDVPCLDGVYSDKQARMHTLMQQTIARINCTYQEGLLTKNYGLIVNFIGLGKYLNEVIATYTTVVKNYSIIESIEAVVAELKNKYKALSNMFYNFE